MQRRYIIMIQFKAGICIAVRMACGWPSVTGSRYEPHICPYSRGYSSSAWTLDIPFSEGHVIYRQYMFGILGVYSNKNKQGLRRDVLTVIGYIYHTCSYINIIFICNIQIYIVIQRLWHVLFTSVIILCLRYDIFCTFFCTFFVRSL